MDYISKYKCEYCGKVFSGGITGNEKIAFQAIILRCVNNPYVTSKLMDLERKTFPYKEPHIDSDHYGIGKLIGIEIKRGET